MPTNLKQITLVSWNVRGLGDKDKRADVRLAFPSPPPTFICIQESKLQALDQFTAASCLPAPLSTTYAFKPSLGASSGLVTAWDPNLFSLLSTTVSQFSITTAFQSTSTSAHFTMTNCYGPCHHSSKHTFLDELTSLSSSISGPWLALGDFNLIRAPHEHSNANFDPVEATWFNDAIDAMALSEVPLLDRRFTWSNHQEPPILVKLDRVLSNIEWNLVMPNSMVTSSLAPTSHHYQLLLTAQSDIPQPAIFRFNNHWLRIPACQQLIASAWNSVRTSLGTGSLTRRLKRCRADLKAWKKCLRSPKDVLTNCSLVIGMLGRLEEMRALFPAEFALRVLVRESAAEHSVQLAAYWRQHGKIKTCVLGDENTSFFHLSATNTWRRHQVRSLQLDDSTLVHGHDAKASLLHSFYQQLLGQATPCSPLPHLSSYSPTSPPRGCLPHRQHP